MFALGWLVYVMKIKWNSN